MSCSKKTTAIQKDHLSATDKEALIQKVERDNIFQHLQRTKDTLAEAMIFHKIDTKNFNSAKLNFKDTSRTNVQHWQDAGMTNAKEYVRLNDSMESDVKALFKKFPDLRLLSREEFAAIGKAQQEVFFKTHIQPRLQQ